MTQLLLILAVGFWTRFAKEPRELPLDSAYVAKQEAKMQKPVQFIYDVDFTTYFDNREYSSP